MKKYLHICRFYFTFATVFVVDKKNIGISRNRKHRYNFLNFYLYEKDLFFIHGAWYSTMRYG